MSNTALPSPTTPLYTQAIPHPLGYSDAECAGFNADLAPFRGNLKVHPNGTFYDARDLKPVILRASLPLTFVYQTCVIDLSTTFLENCMGKFREVIIGYDVIQGLDENGSLVKDHHVQLAGAPINSDGRLIFANSHSAISFDDALHNLAMLYQSALDSWVSAWKGPEEQREFHKIQLSRHDLCITLLSRKTTQNAPTENGVAVPSGNNDATTTVPIEEDCINPTLSAPSFPVQESFAVPSGDNLTTAVILANVNLINPALTAPEGNSMEQAAPAASAQTGVLETDQGIIASGVVTDLSGDADTFATMFTGGYVQDATEMGNSQFDADFKLFLEETQYD